MLSISLGALVARASVTTIIAAALVLSAPAGAHAQQGGGASATASVADVGVLAEGVGMGDRPSLRVRRVQRVLARAGYSLGAPGVDGRFGPLTAAAVRRYQARRDLAVDGIVGPQTRGALAESEARQARAREDRKSSGATSPEAGTTPPPTTTTPQPSATTPQATPTTPQASATTTSPRPSATTPQPAATSGQRAATSTAPRPAATATAPQRVVEQRGISLALLVALAAMALALLSTLAVFGRRRRPKDGGLSTASIGRELMLEGHSDDPAIGTFRGLALASATPRDPENGETRFLIDDPRKPAPIWVSSRDVRRTMSDLPADAPVIGYVSVPPGPSDHEERAFAEIEETCAKHDWQLLEIVRDEEGARMLERPGLTYALERIAAGEAHALVVSDMRRLARSAVDLAALLEWFRDAHATLVALDLGLDTTTSDGDRIADALITIGAWERERIAARTRSGLARVRAEGGRSGRPSVADDPELLARISAMREGGMTLQAISDQLNAEGIPTIRGGAKWRPSSVQAALGYRRPTARNPKEALPPPRGEPRNQ